MSVSSYVPEPNLKDVVRHVWAAKFSIIVGVVIALVLALVFLAMVKPSYRAHMIISPASPMNGAQMSSLLANDNLFAIRHLLQGGTNSADFQSFEQIIHGQVLAASLMEDKIIREGVKADLRAGVLGLGILGQNTKLSPAVLSEYLHDAVQVRAVPGTGFRRLSYMHENAEFSAYLLDAVHKAADAHLRTQTNEGAAVRIHYLKNAIMNTRNPEHRRALTTLLMEQERLKMLSSIDQDYAASVIEPAAAGAKPAWPDRFLVLLIFMLCGGLAGFVIYSLRHDIARAAPANDTQDVSSEMSYRAAAE